MDRTSDVLISCAWCHDFIIIIMAYIIFDHYRIDNPNKQLDIPADPVAPLAMSDPPSIHDKSSVIHDSVSHTSNTILRLSEKKRSKVLSIILNEGEKR